MAISNGIDETQVYEALKERRGWRQPTQSWSVTLNEANTTCLSGRYYQDVHAACNPVSLHRLQEDATITETAYNTWLEELERAVITDAVTSVTAASTLTDKPSLLFEPQQGVAYGTIPNNGKAVGLKIKVADGNNAVQPHNVSFWFDGVANFELYCFSATKTAPLWSVPVVTTANEPTIVPITDKVLRTSDITAKGGYFYLLYFQDDLGSVRAYEIESEKRHAYRLLHAEGMEADATGDHNFQRHNHSATYSTYGMNIELSSYRDITGYVLQRAADFDTLLGLKMAAKCIEISLGSLRENATQRITEQQAGYWSAELHGAAATTANPVGVQGLYARIAEETERLREMLYPKPKGVVVTP